MDQQNLSRKQKRRLERQQEKQGYSKVRRNKKIGRIALWAGIAAVLIGAIVLMVRLVGNSSAPGAQLTNAAITPSDWALGSEQATITLIEYSDIQCPACAAYAPMVRELMEKNADKVRFAYRHFPLDSIHKNAREGAAALEAAGRQGKFFEMMDKLFASQSEWENLGDPRETFILYAQEMSLDSAAFERDMDLDEVKDKVQDHMESGLAARVNHTPTFFVNGKEIPNPRSYEEFEASVLQPGS